MDSFYAMNIDEIKILLVEDEAIWAENISCTLQEFGYQVSGIATNFGQAIDLLNALEYELVLVDININERSKGLELGQMLKKLYQKPFIYVTSDTSGTTISEAVKTGPSAYLTKPVHPATLFATIQAAINNFYEKNSGNVTIDTSGSSIFFVKCGNKYRKIDWNNIVYLASDKNYTLIYNSDDNTEYFIRSTLAKTLEHIIPTQLKLAFVQVNRAEAIQIKYIQELVGEEVRTSIKTFTLTDSYSPGLKKAIRILN